MSKKSARREREMEPPVSTPPRRPWLWPLIAILMVGAFLRLHDLKSAPPGLSYDEAINGVNVLEAIETGDWRVFYPENNGREGLYINLQGLFVRALMAGGSTGDFLLEPWMLRVPSAAFGTLTVLGMFLLGRRLLGSAFAGLAAAFFTATSFWHINFSRIGFRAIMAPFWLVWALWLLYLGFDALEEKARRRGYLLLAIAGLCYGLGFHSYIAYRVTPVIVIFALAVRARRLHRVEWMRGTAVFAGVALLAALPLLVYFAGHTQALTGRAAQVSVFQSKTPAADFLGNLWKTVLMFNVSGDRFWRHNVAGRPELFLPVGLLFLAGVAHLRKAPEHVLCLLWLAVAIVPAALSNEGQPHALRSLLAIPACFLFAAMAAQWLRPKLEARFSRSTLLAGVAVVAAFLAWEPYATYFGKFVTDAPHMATAFETGWAQMAQSINALPREAPKYFVMIHAKLDERGTPPSLYSMALLIRGFNERERRMHNIHFVVDAQEADRAAHVPGAYVYSIDSDSR